MVLPFSQNSKSRSMSVTSASSLRLLRHGVERLVADLAPDEGASQLQRDLDGTLSGVVPVLQEVHVLLLGPPAVVSVRSQRGSLLRQPHLVQVPILHDLPWHCNLLDPVSCRQKALPKECLRAFLP